MINALPPALVLILGALPLIFLKGKAKGVWLLVLPVLMSLFGGDVSRDDEPATEEVVADVS
mgnify:CR=1 FL=1